MAIRQDDVIDYNIQPPGYSSVEMMEYSIEELILQSCNG